MMRLLVSASLEEKPESESKSRCDQTDLNCDDGLLDALVRPPEIDISMVFINEFNTNSEGPVRSEKHFSCRLNDSGSR